MKVLYISLDRAIFDENSYVRAILRQHAAAIGSFHVVARSPARAHLITEGPLVIHPVYAWRPFLIRSLAKEATRIATQEGITVISAEDPFEAGCAALRAARPLGAKLHIQVTTDFLSPWFLRSGNIHAPYIPMPSIYRTRVRMADDVLPHANAIRAVSKRVADSLHARYAGRIPIPSVIPLPLPGPMPEPVSLPPRLFHFSLITVGRLEPEKRIEDILEALATLHDRYPSVGLVIVGDGSRRAALERRVRSLGIASRVLFTGECSNEWGMVRSCQAYIQSSAYEGYGPMLVEAALARIPIITTDVGIVGEAFKGYEDLIAVPPSDPAAIAVAIAGILEDMTIRQSYVDSAELAIKRYLASCPDPVAALAADFARLTDSVPKA